ncbi:MAG: N-acetyl-gamma-glutamyl-phosphate reductase [Phycisphaerae bacterium]|nr:N-acetyl-gamma-glutamyl-phosphate reductase [Phycisphaerae bacterium]
MNIRVAIVGPTSYTSLHLIEILLRHPGAELAFLASRRDPAPNLFEEFPQLQGRLANDQAICRPIDTAAIARVSDIAFTCVPHSVSMRIVPSLLAAGLRVIDLSADYRLLEAALYERVYGCAHTDRTNLPRARYGLPELFRDQLREAELIANPGCYPTAAALGIEPLLSRRLVHTEGIIINAASGVTGAGRSPKAGTHFPEHNESFYAYGSIGGHRHQPEIEQTLSRVAGAEANVLFVPHLLPLDFGILETIYLDPARPNIGQPELSEAIHDAWDNEPFVRVRTDPPNIKHVRGTNFCDVAVRCVDTAVGPKIVVFSAIDNMIKGASGQAVQNMNLMFGLDETTGLM